MKLTINKYLNARVQQPFTHSVCQFYKTPGDTIEIDDVLIGTEIDGNSIWYHCKDDGCFYWSGGIAEQDFAIQGKIINRADFFQIINSIKNDKSFYLSKTVVGYKGIGIGLKNDDGNLPLCLVIFVTKKIALSQLTNSIPPVIAYKGFKIATDVKEVLQPQTHDFIDYKNGEQLRPDNSFSPLAIGASISNNTSNQVSSGYGTRTLLVKKNDKHYLLSCFHVLLYNTVNTTNDLIYNKLSGEEAVFPSPLINITFPNNNRFTHPIVEGEFSGFYDYGLVELQSPFEVQNNFDNTIITEFVERENVELYANTQVTAIGATSYKQTGKITSIKAEIDLKCRGVIRRYFNVIVTDKLSMPGDSGAPVVTNDNKLLGYIVGGNGENTSFIIPFYNLFLNKDITI